MFDDDMEEESVKGGGMMGKTTSMFLCVFVFSILFFNPFSWFSGGSLDVSGFSSGHISSRTLKTFGGLEMAGRCEETCSWSLQVFVSTEGSIVLDV